MSHRNQRCKVYEKNSLKMRKNNLLGDRQRGRNLNWRQQDDQILGMNQLKLEMMMKFGGVIHIRKTR